MSTNKRVRIDRKKVQLGLDLLAYDMMADEYKREQQFWKLQKRIHNRNGQREYIR